MKLATFEWFHDLLFYKKLLFICNCYSFHRLLFIDLSLLSVNSNLFMLFAEAGTGGVLQEKVFLEIWQNSQESTRAKVSFLIKFKV